MNPGTLIIWLMLWIAGSQTIATQPQAQSPGYQYICTEPPPSRDTNNRLSAPVCGSIEGTVVRAASNVGIANVRVTLGPPGLGGTTERLEVVTDANGRFIFPSIKPSVAPDGIGYSISASADGHQPAPFGQTGGPYSPGETIYLLSGTHPHFTLKLNPYQTASGSIRTVDYLSIPAALVRSYRIRYSLLGRRMKIAKSGLTTDLGDYRLFGMEPGDYFVSASYSERSREFPLFGAKLTPNLTNPDVGFVTRFYPAAVAPSDAMAFTMLTNTEKSNLNITLKEAERFKVRIRVFAASNALTHHFNIAMMPAGAELEDASDYAVDEKGSSDFEVEGVATGHYSLVAFDKARVLSEPMPITVDQNIEARITVYDPVDVPGVIVDDAGNPIPGNFPGKWSIRLVRTDPELGQTIHADVNSGNFVVPDLGPGAYDVYIDGLPFGTYIKDVQFPVNDGPFGRFGRIRIEPERPKRIFDEKTQRWRTEPIIQIVLTTSDLVVVGWVWTGAYKKGIPEVVPNAVVVLEPDLRPEDPYALREDRFVIGSADGGGFFRWVGVPPGIYTVFGFVEIPPGLYFDSQFNERIASKGVKVTAEPGKAFELTGCMFPPYVDPYYVNRAIIPPADSGCIVRLPREESVGIAP